MNARMLAGPLDALACGAVLVDDAGRVLHWNRRLEAWTGITKEHARNVELRSLLPGLRRPRYELRIEEVLRGGPPVTFDSLIHDSPLDLDPSHGAPRNVRVHFGSYYDFSARCHMGLMTIEDRTPMHAMHDELRAERDRAEQAAARERDAQGIVRQEKDHLEAANDELQQFAYMASHDLREPLHKVRMFARLLEDDVADLLDGEALEMVQSIGSATERLEGLLTESLALLRAGESVDDPLPLDCETVIADTIDDLATKIDEADAVVEVDDVPPILADGVSIHHLVLNLLSNALKFRHPDRRCRVNVSAARGSLLVAEGDLAAVRLTIRDNGIGFDPRHATEIFKPFRRLHGRSDSYAGHGLGLAICRRIVRRLGGQIWAESVPGEGTTFHVMLPAAVDADSTQDVSRSEPVAAGF